MTDYIIAPDPVKHCPVYREIGCSHVDGFLCDMRDCQILRDYLEGKIEITEENSFEQF